jgi:dephospho-CoA kinase
VILGITGGIATGKSTAARFFGKLGAALVSADDLAREAVAPGTETLKKLVEHFGPRIIRNDGSLNRKVLGDIVFNDPEARRFLNETTHARIGVLAVSKLKELKEKGVPLIIYESPLLFEAGVEDRVDAVLVITTSRENQIERILRRPGMTLAKAEAMIDSQMSQEEKAARADYVIDSNGTRDELKEKVRLLFERLTAEKGA